MYKILLFTFYIIVSIHWDFNILHWYVEMHELKAKITWFVEFSNIDKGLISSNVVILKFYAPNADPFHNFQNKKVQKLGIHFTGKSLKGRVYFKTVLIAEQCKQLTITINSSAQIVYPFFALLKYFFVVQKNNWFILIED